MTYFVYIIESLKDGTYYVGSTEDLPQRIGRHNQGRSKYTKAKRPWKLLYYEEYLDRADAVNREKQIKRRKSREYIETMVSASRQT